MIQITNIFGIIFSIEYYNEILKKNDILTYVYF